MKLSMVVRASLLGMVLGGCSGGTAPGTVSADPAGPFSGSGSPGPFGGTPNSADPLGTHDNAGTFAGQGSPGAFSAGGADTVVTGASGTSCDTVCARFDGACAVACAASCNEQIAAASAACLASLYPAYLACLQANLTCVNGALNQGRCQQPDCTTAQ